MSDGTDGTNSLVTAVFLTAKKRISRPNSPRKWDETFCPSSFDSWEEAVGDTIAKRDEIHIGDPILMGDKEQQILLNVDILFFTPPVIGKLPDHGKPAEKVATWIGWEDSSSSSTDSPRSPKVNEIVSQSI